MIESKSANDPYDVSPLHDLKHGSNPVIAGDLMPRKVRGKVLAERLHISVDSVNEHITVLVQKLHAANRTEAVAIAQRKHLLKI